MQLEDYSKYYIQGSDHYLIPKYDFIELYNKMIYWKEESIELKEKIKKLSQWDTNKDTRNSRQRVANAKLLKENKELKKQLEVGEEQYKEFIEFLEDNWKETQDIWYIKILQKYKSIIGDDENGRE